MKTIMSILACMIIHHAYAGDIAPTMSATTTHFTVVLPSDWSVNTVTNELKRWKYGFFNGTNLVFQAEVWTGTEFLECFCAPWDKYEVIKRTNEEARVLRLDDKTRTLKIAGQRYSLDIHATFKGYSPDVIDNILTSIRMNNE